MAQKWTGTKQRDDLKRCPFCDTRAVQQVRLADNDTGMQWRIGCGNSFCLVEPNTPPYAALTNAEHAWQDRPATSCKTCGGSGEFEAPEPSANTPCPTCGGIGTAPR
jgi:hypothetical protein